MSLTLATAFVTPFPAHLVLSPSRSSTASCCPNAHVSLLFVNIDFGFVRTGGSAGWDDGTVETGLSDDVNLDSGVTTRIVDRTSLDLGDCHDCGVLIAGLRVSYESQCKT